MGRGQRDQALTNAQGLLYGPRHSGNRSSAVQAGDPLPVPETFIGLSRPESLDGLLSVTAALGLSQQLTRSEQNKIGREVNQISDLLTIDIKQPSGKRLRMVARLNGEDKTVGAYYIDDYAGADAELEAGDTLFDEGAASVDLLRDKLKELGIKRFAFLTSPEEIYERFENNEPVELDNGRDLLNSQYADHREKIAHQARNITFSAKLKQAISEEQETALDGLIDGLPEDGNLLEALAVDTDGRKALNSRDWLYVTERLNP